MSTVTIRFRAKLERVDRIRGTAVDHDVPAYRVPKLTAAHVAFTSSTLQSLARTQRDVDTMTRARFIVPAGSWAHADDDAWMIVPCRSGAFADVVGTFAAVTR